MKMRLHPIGASWVRLIPPAGLGDHVVHQWARYDYHAARMRGEDPWAARRKTLFLLVASGCSVQW